MARLSITQAAQRLNVSVDVIRRRVRKAEIPGHRDNRGQWWVELPDDAAPEAAMPSVEARLAPAYAPPDTALADALRVQVADLAARLDQAGAERARLVSIIEAMAAPRPDPAPPRPDLLTRLVDALRRLREPTPTKPNS